MGEKNSNYSMICFPQSQKFPSVITMAGMPCQNKKKKKKKKKEEEEEKKRQGRPDYCFTH